MPLATLVTNDQVEHTLWVRNAPARIAEWVATGELAPAGFYRPGPRQDPVPLYRADDVLALAWGRVAE